MDLSTIYLIAVPTVLLSIAGFAFFFSSDYAQRRWSPDEK